MKRNAKATSSTSSTFNPDDLFQAVGLKATRTEKQAFGDYTGYAGHADCMALIENNMDYIWDIGEQALRDAGYAPSDWDEDDEKAVEVRDAAESRVSGALYMAYMGTALSVITAELSEAFDLDLKEKKEKSKAWGGYQTVYAISPKTSWQKSARLVMETINGVGYFDFNSLAEFLASGPYTARKAVLQHLHYLAQYGDVYGDPNLNRKFEKELNRRVDRIQ